MGGRGWDLVAMAKAIHRTEAKGWHEGRRSRRSLRGWRSRRDETRAMRGAGEEAELPAHPLEVGRWSTRSRRRANGVRRGMRVSPTDPVPPAETPSNTSATVVRSTAVKQARFGRLDLACKVSSNGFTDQAHPRPVSHQAWGGCDAKTRPDSACRARHDSARTCHVRGLSPRRSDRSRRLDRRPRSGRPRMSRPDRYFSSLLNSQLTRC